MRKTDYEVGYGRPPQKHQFRKGISGNLNGRPRKNPARTQSPAYAELDDILLKEALRPITIRENDEVVVIPMIQAVLRSLGVAAVKGHHRSQIVLANMVKSVQSARNEERRELFQKAVDYKDGWREAFEAADRRGEPRPEPVPHPDEIVLDTSTMEVRINGPSSPDHKASWDLMLKRKATALEEIERYKKKLKRPSKNKEFYEDRILSEQENVDFADAFIPDESLRRRPGFDIREWRESNPKFQAELKKYNAEKTS